MLLDLGGRDIEDLGDLLECQAELVHVFENLSSVGQELPQVMALTSSQESLHVAVSPENIQQLLLLQLAHIFIRCRILSILEPVGKLLHFLPHFNDVLESEPEGVDSVLQTVICLQALEFIEGISGVSLELDVVEGVRNVGEDLGVLGVVLVPFTLRHFKFKFEAG